MRSESKKHTQSGTVVTPCSCESDHCTACNVVKKAPLPLDFKLPMMVAAVLVVVCIVVVVLTANTLLDGGAPHRFGSGADCFSIDPSLTELTPMEGKHGSTPCIYALPQPNITDKVVLILPGGAYRRVAKATEGAMSATKFERAGFAVFVLMYRVPPGTSDAPTIDAANAIRTIQRHAEYFRVAPDARLGLVGFSAGGHAAASYAAYGRLAEDFSGGVKPWFLMLCYPVISMEPRITHNVSAKMLLRLKRDEFTSVHPLVKRYSLEYHARDFQFRHVYIWTTADDEKVPAVHSHLMERALVAAQIDVKLNVYPKGKHAGWTKKNSPKEPKNWFADAHRWILELDAPSASS